MADTKTIAPDALLLEQLETLDWDSREGLWIKLMARCSWLAYRRYTLKWNNEEVKAFSRQIISEVIEKIFISKKRTWNTTAYPDFEDFIVGAVDSHFNNTLKKQKKEINSDEDFIFNKNGETIDSNMELSATTELRDHVYESLKRAGACDEELLIFECIADGLHQPKDIRNDLGITDSDYHNNIRKLQRRLGPIKKKLRDNGY